MSKVLVRTEEGEKELMDDVISVELIGEEIRVREILGAERTIRGRVEKVDLLRHRVVLRESNS